jgi:hypothetical protein
MRAFRTSHRREGKPERGPAVNEVEGRLMKPRAELTGIGPAKIVDHGARSVIVNKIKG